MRIAFIARSTLHAAPGGDTVQLLATAKYLRKAGVEVDIKYSTDTIEYHSYDLLHFFNLIRPADILKHTGCGIPYVVSTILVDYTGYDKTQRKGMTAPVFNLLPPGLTEYAKALARYISGRDAIADKRYLWLGHNRSIRKIIRGTACLLPNSAAEYQRLVQTYRIEKKHMVIPNGIDTDIFPGSPSAGVKEECMVVCAARVEGIKNQLNLIRALNNTRFRLYLIGNAAAGHTAYYRACKKTAADNIVFLGNLPQTVLADYYRRAKVHVLPSWFETTGLSSLEAAAMGCNIVISTKGDAKEYFSDQAFYCDPSSPASICQAVEEAAGAKTNIALEQEIRRKFTWEQAAFCTIQAYQSVLCG